MNGYNINGRRLDTPLYLNGGQIRALEEISRFIEDEEENCVTLTGGAGTGKTTMLSLVRDLYRFEKRLQFCATTHKAAGVLKKKTGEKACTVNSLFGIIVEQDFDREAFDVSYKKRSEAECRLARKSIVFIDEASMLSEENFADIMCKARDYGCKIVFVGDEAQLPPVGEDDISIVFRTELGRKIILERVERTGEKGIIDEASRIREGKGFSMEDSDGVEFIDRRNGPAVRKVFEKYIPGLKDDPDFFRFLSYTNKDVEAVNGAIRRLLGYGDSPVKGEPVMAYANWGYDFTRRLTGSPYKFVNSEGYIIEEVQDEKKVDVTKYIEVERSSDEKIEMTVTPLVLAEPDGGKVTVPYVDVIGRPENMTAAILLSQQKKLLWNRWRTADKKDRGMLLARISEIDSLLFVNDAIRDEEGHLLQNKVIDYGYAHTIHKSQGSTFSHVLVNDADILKCPDPDTVRMLRYVGVTRASESVSIMY